MPSQEADQNDGLRLGLYPIENSEIYISIHNQTGKFDRHNKIPISPHMKSIFKLSRTFETRLGPPYSKCKTNLKFTPGPYAITNRSIFPYFQRLCFRTCRFEKISNLCNKSQDYFDNSQYFYTNDTYYFEYVHNLVETNCYNERRKIDQLLRKYGENEICKEICPIECHSIKYSVMPLYIFNHTNPRSDIEIYYESFSSTWIKQIPKVRADALFSSIGGIVGLFLGCSVITLGELVEFFYSHIWIIIDYKKDSRKKKVTNQKKCVQVRTKF